MHDIISTLRLGPFLNSLFNDPLENIEKLKIRVALQMIIQEKQNKIINLPKLKGFLNNQPFKA